MAAERVELKQSFNFSLLAASFHQWPRSKLKLWNRHSQRFAPKVLLHKLYHSSLDPNQAFFMLKIELNLTFTLVYFCKQLLKYNNYYLPLAQCMSSLKKETSFSNFWIFSLERIKRHKWLQKGKSYVYCMIIQHDDLLPTQITFSVRSCIQHTFMQQ